MDNFPLPILSIKTSDDEMLLTSFILPGSDQCYADDESPGPGGPAQARAEVHVGSECIMDNVDSGHQISVKSEEVPTPAAPAEQS